jgi:hypothetical protein
MNGWMGIKEGLWGGVAAVLGWVWVGRAGDVMMMMLVMLVQDEDGSAVLILVKTSIQTSTSTIVAAST